MISPRRCSGATICSLIVGSGKRSGISKPCTEPTSPATTTSTSARPASATAAASLRICAWLAIRSRISARTSSATPGIHSSRSKQEPNMAQTDSDTLNQLLNTLADIQESVSDLLGTKDLPKEVVAYLSQVGNMLEGAAAELEGLKEEAEAQEEEEDEE